MLSLKLKANAKGRVLQGHPWVFGNEVEALLPPELDGEVVECRDRSGRLLGYGIYNSRSQIAWRRLSREKAVLDRDYIKLAVEKALARREEGAVGTGSIRRVVWSEADELPGVVADQFGDVVVLQVQTLAMEKRSEWVAEALREALGVKEVIFRNDAPIRRLEGLPQEVHTLSGAVWEPRWVGIDGVEYWLDLQNGQKTGFYLDQREQHALVAAEAARLTAARGRPLRVLDLFCNQGPFLLQCAKRCGSAGSAAPASAAGNEEGNPRGPAVVNAKTGEIVFGAAKAEGTKSSGAPAGAAAFLGVDSAEQAVGAARRNAERNGLACEFLAANVFDWLNAPERSREAPWDLIILDPPPFTKKRGSMEGALRGYKEINLRALQILAPGGLLATYTCSHHMQDPDLRGVLAEAAADAKRRVRVEAWCHQPKDHPVLATMPESEYLRGYFLSA